MSSLEIHNYYGPSVYALLYTGHENQIWIWNATDGIIKSKSSNRCLTVPLDLELWAGPLSGGSQAVLLLNRSDSNNEQITVKWTDIGFPNNHLATVRYMGSKRYWNIYKQL